MAAFSCSFEQQQQPFILDSLVLPNHNHPMIKTLDDDQLIITKPPPSSVLTLTNNNNHNNIITTMDDSSSTAAADAHHVTDHTHKRKSQQSNSAQSKVNKGKKQLKKMKKNVVEKLDCAATGYIHVRARRGQATDSHSLAERVRREKISERMKLLQALVPGCDKVTGKAPMLDQIINYIQSLQYQTEFLSMRLASLSPTYYDFETDLESFMVRPDQVKTPPISHWPSPSMEACSRTTAIDYYHSDHSLLLQQAQMSEFVLPQAASRQNPWEVDELRRHQHQHVFFPLI